MILNFKEDAKNGVSARKQLEAIVDARLRKDKILRLKSMDEIKKSPAQAEPAEDGPRPSTGFQNKAVLPRRSVMDRRQVAVVQVATEDNSVQLDITPKSIELEDEEQVARESEVRVIKNPYRPLGEVISMSRTSLGQRSNGPLRPYVQGENNFEDYELEGKCLGKGAFAVVRKAVHRPSGKIVACKTYNRLKLTNARDLKNLYNEIEILSSLEHPGIVALFEKHEQTRHIHLILECAGELNLKDFLKARKQWLSVQGTRQLFRRIVEGVAYLHKMDVAHRDIKLNNIVLRDLAEPKLIDFGFARRGAHLNHESGCGTTSYMAPELLSSSNTGKRASKADVWALGVLLYYLLTRKYPFRASNDNVLFHKIRSDKPNLWIINDPDAVALLDKIFNKNQDLRPSCEEILRHPFCTL